MKDATTSTAGHIWDTLSRIDVSDHTEKKGKLTYLSWAWAWQELMARFPDTVYDFTDRHFDDGTMEVTCHMAITVGAETVTRMMWLPVMDNRNNPIQNPDAFQINTAKMRCLTKCISMYGLGSYIYAGEDLPQAVIEERAAEAEKPVTKAQVKLLKEAVEHSGRSLVKLMSYYDVDKLEKLTFAQFEQALHACEREIAKQAQLENIDVEAGLS